VEHQVVRKQTDPEVRTYRGSRGGSGFLSYSDFTTEMDLEMPRPFEWTVPIGGSFSAIVVSASAQTTGTGRYWFSLRTVINPARENIAVGDHHLERWKFRVEKEGATIQTEYMFPIIVERLEPVTFQVHPLLEGGVRYPRLEVNLQAMVGALRPEDISLELPGVTYPAPHRQPVAIQLRDEE